MPDAELVHQVDTRLRGKSHARFQENVNIAFMEVGALVGCFTESTLN